MASRPQPFSPAACATWLVLGCLFSGCARSVSPAEPGAEAPTSSPGSPTSASATETLEQAEEELERARLALAQLGGSPRAPAPAPASSPVTPSGELSRKRSSADEAPPAPPASQAPSRKEKSSDQAESEASPRDSGNDKCETTCRAYASLLRAKSAVCRLDAPNGARCARAEGIVRDATPQVQSCQCGS
jgi:hypothetical protein